MNHYGLPSPLTPQTLFDKALCHIREQGRGSYIFLNNDGIATCAYRTPEGLACAVGCLISDQTAAQGDWTDHASLGSILDEVARDLESGYSVADEDLKLLQYRDLLRATQTAHDRHLAPHEALGEEPEFQEGAPENMFKWERDMKAIAEEYELTYAPPSGTPAWEKHDPTQGEEGEHV